ncbi:MAG: LacI family DNA-binding transcriptional regulator [Opitutaceae bacterium]|nr:LacI family DNA-binding transcriptional regulator [Cephaloticoccus sp.]MCP5530443.1 LacI family DNA-binding transcriptional regulator [Opitutaceae bacterium]
MSETRNLNAVAKLAGVSTMTASRVMRNHPHVSAKTKLRVLRAAKQLHYSPDPHVARLMERVRSYRQHQTEATIALIRDDTSGDELLDIAYHYVPLEDIRSRSRQHGYQVSEFRLNRKTMSVRRLEGILEARGIEGLIVSPQSAQSIGSELDYSKFAAVTLGYGLQQPAIHRASTNMTRGIHQVTTELAARGYRRIGLAVTQWIDARSDHTYAGAMLNYQRQIPPKDRVPLLMLPKNNIADDEKDFVSWFKRHRPEVIISFDNYIPDWLTRKLGLRIPEDVGLVVHDWLERHASYAGIDHNRAQVAAAAIDLLATMLMHNERGVPAVPRQVLVPPEWVDGPSIRPR